MAALMLLWLVAACAVGVSGNSNLEMLQEGIQRTVEPNLEAVEERLTSLMRQYGLAAMWQQQTEYDEKRMQGDSGIMQVRNVLDGTKPWATNSWSRKNGQAAIHDHANNWRTVGMCEVAVSMNGVYFRTRHNDYRLYQPHTNDSTFGAYEEVEFPPVPPSVLEKTTVAEQIAEMKEYFIAWKDQNPRHRDYKPYFKPVIVYMEGMWTIDDGNKNEIFKSDRHSFDADTWLELQQKIMFSVWTGKKSERENLATLPTMLYNISEDGTPQMAQWNYRIMAHPLSVDVPTSRFRLVEDLSPMVRNSKGRDTFPTSRSARFQLHPEYTEENFNGLWREEGPTSYANFIDKLMSEVPGVDNYQADISDYNSDDEPFLNGLGNERLNAGFYHRYYTLGNADASGFEKAARGFADANLYVAYNTQPGIVPVTEKQKVNGQWREKTNRATYALPLEIVYMTPLLRWNPYDIVFWGDDDGIPKDSNRNGAEGNPYNGSSSRVYYRTPAAFFSETDQNGDPADTARDTVWVLDKDGNSHQVTPSGTRVFLPKIPPAGVLRTRYPIFGVYQEGSGIFKELNALTDITLDAPQHIHMYRNVLGGFTSSRFNGNEKFTFALRQATRSPHVHEFLLTANQIKAMNEAPGTRGYQVQVQTSTSANHNHNLVVGIPYKGSSYIRLYSCDTTSQCRDGHDDKADCLDCPDNMFG